MATFQSLVLITAIVILIILLVIIGIALFYQTYSAPWPPKTPLCPDYWVAVPGTVDSVSKMADAGNLPFNYADLSGNSFDVSGAVCVNIKNIGTCSAASGSKYLVKDFTGSGFEGSNGACQKYKWAKGCGVSWDGITYGTKFSPCDPSYSSFLTGGSSSNGKGGQCYLSSMSFSSLGNTLVGNQMF